MALHQLVYQSQALVPFEPRELSALLEQARRYNREHGITGLLLLTPDGRFVQALEGEYDAVRHLYHNRIALDPRHFNCQVLGEAANRKRVFGGWSMGFRPAQPADLRRLLSPVPPDTPALLIPRPHTCPELLAILHDFVAWGETAAELEQPL
ncbi:MULTISPECIES: BLUF domain-containing protein [Hymenobacter]|uniref:BLUF domain-containing protein n=1 Tax=Hymenobacter armeniacus TaxID=2771358 RepID=A0ABR8JQ72_9BACT|nr:MULTISPECIES: BLUF domain-containing protein [Hymenobacter]MBD2720730.1 BLUF domain-containing protein [Hymenobacter armeniacus]MBJ6109932.1 BLUF domain-containing protein [Hymenobacter sp. BT523]